MSMSRLELFSIRARGCSPPWAGGGLSAGAGLSSGFAPLLAQPSVRDSNRSDPEADRRMESLACGGTPAEYRKILPRARLRWTGLVLATLAAGPLSAQTVVPSPARARPDSARGTADSSRPAAADTTRAAADTTRATPYDSVRRDSIGRPVGDTAR